jgi:hypothetical protein
MITKKQINQHVSIIYIYREREIGPKSQHITQTYIMLYC